MRSRPFPDPAGMARFTLPDAVLTGLGAFNKGGGMRPDGEETAAPVGTGRQQYSAGVQAAALGLAIILALITAVTVTVLYFGPISRTAGLLLLPYISWLVFAASLNWWAAAHN